MELKKSGFLGFLLFLALPCFADDVDILGQALIHLAAMASPLEVQDIEDETVGQTQEVVVEGCEKEEQWLKAHGKTYQKAIAQTKALFKKLQDDVRASTLFKGKVIFSAANDAMAIYKGAKESSKDTGSRLTLKDPVNDVKQIKTILVKFGQALKKLDTLDPQDKQALLGHLRMMVMLDGALLPEVLEFMAQNHKFFSQKEQYDLMTDLYRINIGYVELILSLWKSGNLTGGNKADFDRAVNYCAYIKPFIDDAEVVFKKDSSLEQSKNEAKNFVQDINNLSYYVRALLCRKKTLLMQSGFDYALAQRMNEDETSRVWHVRKVSPYHNTMITAPWDFALQYKPGNILLWGDTTLNKNVAVDEQGRPAQDEPKAWVVVDKSKPFYRHYYVELAEMAQVIDNYEKDAKLSSDKVFSSIQNLRKQFVISGIHKFRTYLELAQNNQKVNGENICITCFNFDLYGQRKGSEAFIKKYDKNKSMWIPDKDARNEISKNVDEDLKKIRAFLEKTGETKALADVKWIQQHKESIKDQI